jgi:tetratricopeptide (TPR) repeat protein
MQNVCRLVCFAKTMIGDYSGALQSANWALEADSTSSYCWQERGVLKELMGKYEEALEDLNHASKLSEPVDDYEVLKHRAHVNFKLGHEDEARKDAERALLAPAHYEIGDPGYNLLALGTLSVPQFLGYDLK